MEKKKIKEGDFVSLKGYTFPKMIVVHISEFDPQAYIKCIWFDVHHVLHTEVFPNSVLVPFKTPV